MSQPFDPVPAPELIFGVVAPIGVDVDIITEVLERSLQEMDYDACLLRLTELMKEVPISKQISDAPLLQSYRDRISYANEVCRLLGNDALAALAISAIRAFRAKERKQRGASMSASHGSETRDGRSSDLKKSTCLEVSMVDSSF
jgi:hypothetical protein